MRERGGAAPHRRAGGGGLEPVRELARGLYLAVGGLLGLRWCFVSFYTGYLSGVVVAVSGVVVVLRGKGWGWGVGKVGRV